MKGIYILGVVLLFVSCGQEVVNTTFEGKVERDQITVVTKVPGKIERILVQEGDIVQAGDTLAVLDIPELDAKKEQALGALQSADAQYNMALKGATAGQLVQLQAKVAGLKEQYEFAKKSIDRLENLLKDSLISQQNFDETYAKYQGAKNQYLAAKAEIEEVSNGARYEQQVMALGQKERAQGAVSEVQIAAQEKYLIAPQLMEVESINLKIGELAMAGYPIINGSVQNSTFFRFTLPEDKVGRLKKGDEVTVSLPYLDNRQVQGRVVAIKALNSYANIATAYPDYENQLAVFEVKIIPKDNENANSLLTKTLAILKID
ncbi:biotin/lipoyl-binding protein [Sphingobacterium sp. UT-1RO-CII-1]|uniref:HlyD family secretion protein n=1 Tax=Sphingobacterium sp. UT-1RO-CII-1 TaxID=2995225 RepID=UPI00227BCEFF|nr:biotin/lipoyl-binding protein [Sphingobacterium sp. UT-1RO-CII-1]MCY4779553.1 biotin/lipoyl-binding protein [Sphingobacterium sp. UT-1RO-CII-1]